MNAASCQLSIRRDAQKGHDHKNNRLNQNSLCMTALSVKKEFLNFEYVMAEPSKANLGCVNNAFELMYIWIKGLESPEQVLIRFAQNQLIGGSMEMASSETSLKRGLQKTQVCCHAIMLHGMGIYKKYIYIYISFV